MGFALLWLTISAPFVQASQKYFDRYHSDTRSLTDKAEEDSTNPFGNNTEEKAPSSTNFSEEYLHDDEESHDFGINVSLLHHSQDAGTYIAYHGELLVPPPNKA
jgi:hypothetical protein